MGKRARRKSISAPRPQRLETLSFARPLARRRLITARPFLVAMRARKPWVRKRETVLWLLSPFFTASSSKIGRAGGQRGAQECRDTTAKNQAAAPALGENASPRSRFRRAGEQSGSPKLRTNQRQGNHQVDNNLMDLSKFYSSDGTTGGPLRHALASRKG